MEPLITELLVRTRMEDRRRELREIERLHMILPKRDTLPLLYRLRYTIGTHLVRLGAKMQAAERVKPVAATVHDCP